MTRSPSTGGAARATRSRARAAGPRPGVHQLRPPPRFLCRAEPLEPRRLLSTFTVTTPADAGPGSLRQAILDANALAGPDDIRFDLPGEALQTISVLAALPDVTDPLTLDATTQPGYAGVPRVEIRSSPIAAVADGLTARATTVVRGLAIAGFGGRGVAFLAGSGSRLAGCYVGLSADGGPSGNGRGGVVVSAPDTTIGGPAAADRNVISNNGGPGIHVSGTAGAVIENAYVGTTPDGNAARGNAREGVLVEASSNVRIGSGTRGQLTLVSGNSASGIRLAADVRDVTINGTYVGTNAAGDAPVSNGRVESLAYRDGITTSASNVRVGGAAPQVHNVISANRGSGVAILGGTGIRIYGSYIGTDAAGGRALGVGSVHRQGYGVRIAGGAGIMLGDSGALRNVISGNGGSGILLEGTNGAYNAVWVMSNYIGTDAAGARAVPNGGWPSGDVLYRDGITVTAPGPGSVRIGDYGLNAISGNAGAGIRVNGTVSTYIQSAWVGVDAAGNAPVPNQGDGIVISAGNAEVAGCTVSGNRGAGVRVAAPGSLVLSTSYIGTDVNGGRKVPNGGNGVEVFDTLAQIGRYDRDGNVISGNLGHGVLVAGPRAGASLFANFIGTARGGLVPLGNAGSGVHLASSNVMVGRQVNRGSPPDSGNVISANGGNGITITDFFGAPTSGVRIYNNAIGTNAARSLGAPGLGNAGHGVAIINSSRNSVGGIDASGSWEYGNTIAFNAGSGVLVQRTSIPFGPAADANLVNSNSIFANGGAGIDLGGDGVTPNDPLDADAGPNTLQNFPVIQGPVTAGGATALVPVRFTLDSEPNKSYTVQIFTSPEADPSGHGEGAKLLGAATVQTDANGHAARSVSLRGVTGYLTATVSGTGGTSEFAPAVRVVGPAVVGRYVFYNHSAFDGGDAAATPADDAAIAPDKRALRPWELASFANVTGYDKGINGIIIDVEALPAGSTLSAADFGFRSYRPPQRLPEDAVPENRYPRPGAWVGAPGPSEVTVRRGAGAGGADRVTLVWPDRGAAAAAQAVFNRWLEVTVLANARTGLVQPDVFFFGNLVGESGDAIAPAPPGLVVGPLDAAGTRAAQAPGVPITSRFDHNRDGAVNALDLTVVRSNYSKRLDFYPPARATLPNPPEPPLLFSDTATSVLRDEPAGE